MVIVDPDCISSFVLTYNRFCKGSVDSNIVVPTSLLPVFELWIIGNLVMECRPDDLLAVSIIVSFEIDVGYEHGNRSLLGIEIVGDVCLHNSAETVRGLLLAL